jgi:nicotinate-nucleotide pyrophosphorylase (carboxylating)
VSPTDVHPPGAAVSEAVARALAEDVLPLGDLTGALVPESALGRLAFVSRAPGIVAGRRCAEETFRVVDPSLAVDWRLDDGSPVREGDTIAVVTGSFRSILVAERTALNFVCHLSGIATETRRFVDAVAAVDPAVRVLDTRKTVPGLRALQKAAVRAGGGHNHRASLSDAVLIKDNHLGALSIGAAVAAARSRWPGRLVEVECDRAAQVEEAVQAEAGAVLLDNMSPAEAAECVALARKVAGGRGVLVEISGGLSLDTVAAYAATGADLLSVGALTHSVRVLDVGLDLVHADGGGD